MKTSKQIFVIKFELTWCTPYHDTFYQLGECSSVGVQRGVLVGMVCFNVDEVVVENNIKYGQHQCNGWGCFFFARL